MNHFSATDAHVNDQGQFGIARSGRQLPPIGALVAGLGVACDKHHAMCMFAVGQWCAQTCKSGQARCDAVDDCQFNARFTQVFYFFAPASKNKGIAAFQTHHVFAFVNRIDHEFFNESLRRAFAAAAFADMNNSGRG